MTDEDLGSVVLVHHGVKGMKWGVRKDRGHEGDRASTKKIQKLDKKFERGTNGYIPGVFNDNYGNRLHNRMLKSALKKNKSDIKAINDHPKYKGKDLTKDEALMRSYNREIDASFKKRMKDEADALGTNASGTKRYEVHTYGSGPLMGWRLNSVDVAHASDGSVNLKVVRDILGHVISIDLPEGMSHSDLFEIGEEFLAHHGVKGMKWGVRKVRSLASENTPKARGAAKAAKVADQQAHASGDHKEVAARLEKAKAHGTSALTNEDLRKVNDRLNLEQNFNRLTTPQKSAGRKYAENLLKTDGQQALKNAGKKHLAKQIAKKAAIATIL